MSNKLKSVLLTVFGVFLVALGVSLFYVPNKIVSGGLSGFSTILFYSLHIPVSVTTAVLNVILSLLGLKILGKSFTIKTIACSLLLSVFLEICSYIPPVTDNILLGAIFGAVLYGFGIGLAFSQSASTGGTDILGRIAQHFFPHMPIGKLLLFIDGAIILGSYFVFHDANLILYGVIALTVSTYSIDYLIKKLNISKLAFVITSKGAEIAEHLISTSPRGITLFDVTGAYTNEKKHMLMCALKDSEMPEFQNKIKSIDQDAFTIFSESQQIVGNGFRVYR